MKNLRTVKGALVAIVVLIVLGGGGYAIYHVKVAGEAAAAASQTVAVVNGQDITQGQLQVAESQVETQEGISATSTDAQATVQSQALDSLIGQMLLAQAAAKAGIVASSSAIDAQVESDQSQFQSTTTYEQALAAQGLTDSSLRTQIGNDIAIQLYLQKTIDLSSTTASNAEIQAAYNASIQGQTDVPPLSQVRSQVEQMVIEQKQGQDVDALVAQLRSQANVQILI